MISRNTQLYENKMKLQLPAPTMLTAMLCRVVDKLLDSVLSQHLSHPTSQSFPASSPTYRSPFSQQQSMQVIQSPSFNSVTLTLGGMLPDWG